MSDLETGALDDSSPAIDFTRVLSWYRGKGLRDMESFVIPTLTQAIKQGYWPKGASRRVRTMLNKQTVAADWSRDQERDFDVIRSEDGKLRGWSLTHAMEFGHFASAPWCVELARDLLVVATPVQALLIEEAARWAADFAPIADAVDLLDRSRPAPVYEFAEISPTVAANVGSLIGIDFTTIRVPEIRWAWVEIIFQGEPARVMRGEILWPTGTRHGMSRFSVGSQCEACGHGIRDQTNWMPLLADARSAKYGDGPASLWVGRDCARKLFGCVVTGDAIYDERATVSR